MITILLGILSSVFTEVVTALNKKLYGTVLQGDGAFLLAFGMAIIGAFINIAMTPGFSFASFTNVGTLATSFSEVFAVSQIYFLLIMQKLNLDVAPTPTAVNASASMV